MIMADEDGNWTYTFKDLYAYHNGEKITYTMEEKPILGYNTTIDGYIITNTHIIAADTGRFTKESKETTAASGIDTIMAFCVLAVTSIFIFSKTKKHNETK